MERRPCPTHAAQPVRYLEPGFIKIAVCEPAHWLPRVVLVRSRRLLPAALHVRFQILLPDTLAHHLGRAVSFVLGGLHEDSIVASR